jgi:hypothetical protein
MKTLFIISSWIMAILTFVVITMFGIGYVYNIAEETTFSEIFKLLFVIWMPLLFVWGIICFIYVEKD